MWSKREVCWFGYRPSIVFDWSTIDFNFCIEME